MIPATERECVQQVAQPSMKTGVTSHQHRHLTCRFSSGSFSTTHKCIITYHMDFLHGISQLLNYVTSFHMDLRHGTSQLLIYAIYFTIWPFSTTHLCNIFYHMALLNYSYMQYILIHGFSTWSLISILLHDISQTTINEDKTFPFYFKHVSSQLLLFIFLANMSYGNSCSCSCSCFTTTFAHGQSSLVSTIDSTTI